MGVKGGGAKQKKRSSRMGKCQVLGEVFPAGGEKESGRHRRIEPGGREDPSIE